MSREGKGQGLSIVTRGGSSLWEYQFRSRVTKTTTSQILGPAKGPYAITLTQARVKRNEVFAANRAGTLVPRRRRLRSQTATFAREQHGSCKTFAEALEVFVAEKRARYKGNKEIRVFENLARLPIARLPLDEIDRVNVKAALSQWFGTPTAEKMRIKVAQVFKHEGRIGRDNPAERLKGGLPAIEKPVAHHPAMPAEDVPGFMRELATSDTPAARALQWTILTAARAGETLGAKWREIDGDLWIIPGDRMKEGKAHTVPLTPEMLALIGPRSAADELVFGLRDSRAMSRLVEGLPCSVHGFRSTFTDWAAEAGWEFELREIALAHAVSGATAQAYNRSKQVDRRRAMMAAWSAFACRGEAVGSPQARP